ncbi:MAG: exodeoxyribonuclease VII large subunit, partial [Clostridia bacterium]|nr:exodeoxyribonuclease VII large subunit [Clostridia bacterium]
MPDESRILTVTGLNEYVKMLIEGNPVLSNVYVRGEISNLKCHSSGHYYFSLKDEGGRVSAVMFKSAALKLKFRPENGMKVVLHGRVSVYSRDGAYQLYASSLEPDGIGALTLAYEQLKRKLEEEGLFRSDFKKALPKIPSAVGIITSPTGAAVRDIINVSTRRFPFAKLVLFPALVQGDGAEADLIRGIKYFNDSKSVDVIIIGRGGGSIEDLWAFNGEALAREIFKCEIPVISAVGHETDFTICDFVSDKRA